ncbi:hypothetical protein MMC29_006090 [Sticta canariensis]|nr:hypothetical protein [Sticta canariensis]
MHARACRLMGAGLQAHPPENVAEMHSSLVQGYLATTQARSLAQLPDDGYILQALGHHLTWARRLDDLKGLLSNPDWLELKLHGYGTINVVADFRRCCPDPHDLSAAHGAPSLSAWGCMQAQACALQAMRKASDVEHEQPTRGVLSDSRTGWGPRHLHVYLMARADDEVKLMLDAYQMSVSACLQHPQVSLLRSQMAGRLQAVRPSAFQVWFASLEIHGQPSVQLEIGLDIDTGDVISRPEREIMQGEPDRTVVSPACLQRQSLSAASGQAGSRQTRALQPQGLSLEQAGGTQRMTLRGHTAGLQKVLLSPTGIDVITVAQDSTARVWDMEIGDCVLVMEGHTAPVTGVALAGTVLLTSSQDSTLRVWDMEQGHCLHTLTGHRAAVNAVAVTKDAQRAVSVSTDETARIWDLGTGKVVHTLILPSGSVCSGQALAVAPQAARMASFRVLCLRLRCIGWPGKLPGVIWSIALTPNDHHAITGSEDAVARVWNVKSGLLERELAGHKGWIMDMVMAADGATLLTASHDGTARWVHEAQLGAPSVSRDLQADCIVDAAVDLHLQLPAAAETRRVWVLCPLPSGVSAAIMQPCMTPCLIQVQGVGHPGREVQACPGGAHGQGVDNQSGPKCDDVAACSPLLHAANHCVHLSLMRCGALGCRHVLEGHSSWVSDAALAGSGSLGVTCSGDELAVAWDLADGSVLRVLDGHSDEIRSVVLTERGRGAVHAPYLLLPLPALSFLSGMREAGDLNDSAAEDATARVWDLQARPLPAVVRHSSRVHSILAAHGGRSTAVSLACVFTEQQYFAGNDGLMLWDAASGKMVKEIESDSKNVRYLAVSMDGQHALTASSTSALSVWNLETGKCARSKQGSPGSRVKSFAASSDLERVVIVLFDSSISVWETAGMSLAAVLQTRGERDANFGHSSGVNDVAISPDGETVVTVSKDATARVWDADTGRGRHVLRGASSLGQRLHRMAHPCGAAVLWLRQAAQLTPAAELTACPFAFSAFCCAGHTDSVTGACISSDGESAVTCSSDGTARAWNLSSGNCLAVVQHSSAVSLAVFSPDSCQVASCAADCTPLVWEVASGRTHHTLADYVMLLQGHKGEVTSLAFSDDGAELASTSKDSSLCLWELQTGNSDVQAVHVCVWPLDARMLESRPFLRDDEDCSPAWLRSSSCPLITSSLVPATNVHHPTLNVCVDAGTLSGLFMGDAPLTCCAIVGGLSEALITCGDDTGTVYALA